MNTAPVEEESKSRNAEVVPGITANCGNLYGRASQELPQFAVENNMFAGNGAEIATLIERPTIDVFR